MYSLLNFHKWHAPMQLAPRSTNRTLEYSERAETNKVDLHSDYIL